MADGRNEWNECSKDMPDDDINVMGWHRKWDDVEPGFFMDGQWEFLSGGMCNIEPSHWQDYPEPPDTETMYH